MHSRCKHLPEDRLRVYRGFSREENSKRHPRWRMPFEYSLLLTLSFREYIPRGDILPGKNCHFEEAGCADEKSPVMARFLVANCARRNDMFWVGAVFAPRNLVFATEISRSTRNDAGAELDQIQIPRARNGLRPTGYVQFAIDAGGVRFDGSDGDDQFRCNRLIR